MPQVVVGIGGATLAFSSAVTPTQATVASQETFMQHLLGQALCSVLAMVKRTTQALLSPLLPPFPLVLL